MNQKQRQFAELEWRRIMRNTDICIIGAGPAGIFTDLEMLKQGSKKKIVLVEKGKPVE